MSKKSVNQRLTAILVSVATFLFLASSAMAAENPLLVKLPAEINAGMERIYAIGEQSERVIKTKEVQLHQIVEKIHSSEDPRHTVAMQKEYLALRAEVLQALAARTVSIEKELVKIVKNIDLLERVRKDSKKYGLGPDISKDDPAAKQAVQSMLGGFVNLVNMVDQLNPNTDLGNQKDSIILMTTMANSYFGMGDNSSLENQKRYLKEAMVMARAVQGILGLEHDHLMQKLYYVDASNIVRQFGNLKEVIFDKLNVGEGFKRWHDTDNEVINNKGYSSASFTGSAHPGWDQAGIIR